MNQKTLKNLLNKIDSAGYKAYKELKGSYEFPGFTLICDRVSSDPFAAPSKFRLLIPQSIAQYPRESFQNKSREIALRDYLTRRFGSVAQKFSQNRGTGKSGLITIADCGQEVLERTSVLLASK